MLEKESFCKVNLLLNILGKRPDGFHELETLMHPVSLYDRLNFDRGGRNIKLTCNDPILPVNARNLVFRAAALFLKKAGIKEGVRIHLEKRIPVSAGLGGGSGNAAATFLALNELFGHPLASETVRDMAAALGSDIPFFLQNRPALATGRGEILQPLDFFPALRSAHIVLIHPGFGISTAWAYQQLGRFPEAQNGRAGRAASLAALLRAGDQARAGREFYNSLEAPALRKYPLLELFQEFLRENGAWAVLMSGSGSSTFALVHAKEEAERLRDGIKAKFGGKCWTAVVKAEAKG
ncbi:MAG: 4-(cytidine 5'-diphospho)-2-C-methyl-D-erythritol kinase [Verrucomicrobiota bacterium]|jgi:4-diphosphocytidyl-2-C-methyl-D-erythritol kinase